MKRNLLIFALMGAFVFVAAPSFTTLHAQDRHRNYQRDDYRDDQNHRGDHDMRRRNSSRDNDWNRRHHRNMYGYRNYGQYRRTQVGNRRSTWMWRHRSNSHRRDGIRRY